MRHVLIATDLTETSCNALRRAWQMAAEAAAELRVLHVLPSEATDEAEAAARQGLGAQLLEIGGGEDESESGISIRICRGHPAEVILVQATRFNADLIVLGGHGEPRLRDAIFGTTASHVAREARQPVLVAQTNHKAPFLRVMVAIDDSSAEEVLRLALGIQSAQDLFVVHADERGARGLFGGGLIEDVRTEQEAMTRELLEVVRTLRRSMTAPRIHHIVEQGDAIEVIMKAWMDVRPDLLVMGTRGRAGLSRMVGGSHADVVMLGCPSDILVARTGASS